MITPAYAQLMARYNRWQNQSLYRCADALTETQRNENRGAFFGSVHATLSHLVFGDLVWLHRFTGDETLRPRAKSIAESTTAFPDWADLKRARTDLDATIVAWADRLASGDLAGDLTWYSGANQCNLTKPKGLLVAHMFNHQTHHRGQVHGMLTAHGCKPDATDLPFMPQ